MKKIKLSEIIGLIVFIALDQWSKYYAQANLTYGISKEVIPNFFYFTLVYNTGSAWSMLQGQMLFFYVITVIAIIAFGYFFFKSDSKDYWLRWSLILIISGAIGNFIDRIMFKHVRDFLDFYIFGYNYPVFNIADSLLCIGMVSLFIYVFVNDKGDKK